jgi:hypothetical protein
MTKEEFTKLADDINKFCDSVDQLHKKMIAYEEWRGRNGPTDTHSPSMTGDYESPALTN